jgi:hypothetical protein
MVMNGALGDRESLRQLALGVPARYQPEDFDFTIGESCHPGALARAYAMARGRQRSAYGFIIKQPSPYLAAQFGTGFFSSLGWTIRTLLSHSVIDICGG